MGFNLGGAISGATSGSAFGPWGAIGGGLAGGFLGGGDNSADVSSAAAANAANLSESQKNRDFQLMMSSTAHQREVKDLIAAGLNPMLSVNSGASTGTGSMAVSRNEREGISDRNITRQINSAQIAKLIADTRLSAESANTQRTQQEVNSATADNLRGNVNLLGLKIPLSTIRSKLSGLKNSASSAFKFLGSSNFVNAGG